MLGRTTKPTKMGSQETDSQKLAQSCCLKMALLELGPEMADDDFRLKTPEMPGS